MALNEQQCFMITLMSNKLLHPLLHKQKQTKKQTTKLSSNLVNNPFFYYQNIFSYLKSSFDRGSVVCNHRLWHLNMNDYGWNLKPSSQSAPFNKLFLRECPARQYRAKPELSCLRQTPHFGDSSINKTHNISLVTEVSTTTTTKRKKKNKDMNSPLLSQNLLLLPPYYLHTPTAQTHAAKVKFRALPFSLVLLADNLPGSDRLIGCC